MCLLYPDACSDYERSYTPINPIAPLDTMIAVFCSIDPIDAITDTELMLHYLVSFKNHLGFFYDFSLTIFSILVLYGIRVALILCQVLSFKLAITVKLLLVTG